MGMGRNDNAGARRDDANAWRDDHRARAWGDVACDWVAVAIRASGKTWAAPHCNERQARLSVRKRGKRHRLSRNGGRQAHEPERRGNQSPSHEFAFRVWQRLFNRRLSSKPGDLNET
jgi:hypothetical protein